MPGSLSSAAMATMVIVLAGCGASAAAPASPSSASGSPSLSVASPSTVEAKTKPAAEKESSQPSQNPKPAASAPASAAGSPSSPSLPRGVFVYSEHLSQDANQLSKSLTVQGVDGLTLLQGWAALEPQRGSFEWSELDQWVKTAASAGKQIVLAIRAGQDTPCWLFQSGCPQTTKSYAGATPLNFSVSPREGFGQSKCNEVTVAAPWDPVFQSEWSSLLAAVAGHLKSAGTYGALASVRLTGIDRTTSELRLPAEVLTSPCVTNSIETWLKASPSYRPSLLLDAWDKLTNAYQASFPDKFFGLELIPTASGADKLEYPFPAIDDMGCAYQPPWPANSKDSSGVCLNKGPVPDQNAPLLAMAKQKFVGRLSLSYQNLDLTQPAQPYVVQQAQALGAKIGFQTNDYDNLQRAACSGSSQKPGACDSSSYLKLLEVGIYPLGKNNPSKALYIEVLPPDAIAFPTAVQQAHAELTS